MFTVLSILNSKIWGVFEIPGNSQSTKFVFMCIDLYAVVYMYMYMHFSHSSLNMSALSPTAVNL